MKTYRDSPAAARCYLEADRSRGDDYYLAEGAGVAQRYVASPDGGVRSVSALTGDGYEAWVAGVDPATGVAKGRLRNDARAVRFVEVVVNGPKSWSLAAALHPEVSAALDAAQDRAASQIIAWLAEHATTRVGPRGGQVQVPVEQVEAAVIRHYTSRAGDPHRHLHLQVNARVRASGAWRGLHTVGVRDSLGAINGIGHAAVVTDPGFQGVLAAHGYTLDQTGEIVQLAPYVGAFSRRATQIQRNIDRFEAEWTSAHPGEQAGPGLRRAWDARAWAEDRPDKATPHTSAELHQRWLTELTALGHRDPDLATPLGAAPIGALDRDAAVGVVLARLGARRSAWNAADIRGEVELLLARAGVITDAAVRGETAEDLTARALDRCLPLLGRGDLARAVPEHVRALTSAHVLGVEADVNARLAARTATRSDLPPTFPLAMSSRTDPASQIELVGLAVALDVGQVAAVTALTSAHRLVLVEGPAGAGKTAVLTAAREQLAREGRRLVVVTPTLKAAQVAARDTGAVTGSAAWLAYQHGWRWGEHGTWTRLTPGDPNPNRETADRTHPDDRVNKPVGRVYERSEDEHDRLRGRVNTLSRRVNTREGWGDTPSGGVYRGPHPNAVLRRGDVLVVDEAGMLDQDTARALLTIADELDAQLALMGDRRQLTAVGRGGVLDLAAHHVHPDAHIELTGVHRFTCNSARTVNTSPAMGKLRDDAPPIGPVADVEYAQLTLAMRAGENPGGVFDALLARGQIAVHRSHAERVDALAEEYLATDHIATEHLAADYFAADYLGADYLASLGGGRPLGRGVAIVADTGEQVEELNTAIRGRLVVAGVVEDRPTMTATTDAGVRIGVGDVVVTRRNDHALGVANRDTWTVTRIHADGGLRLIDGEHRQRTLSADYVSTHVELGYASTVYGVQGDTVPTGHLVIGEHTTAAAGYVGMTRGRQQNTAHLVADTPAQARKQWIEVFTRDRADLGASHAAEHARREAQNYAPLPPTPDSLEMHTALPSPTRGNNVDSLTAAESVEDVVVGLKQAWTLEALCVDRLEFAVPKLDLLREVIPLVQAQNRELAAAEDRYQRAKVTANHSTGQVEASATVISEETRQLFEQTQQAWAAELEGARAAAQTVLAGPGRFGHRMLAVNRAVEDLATWSTTWQPYLPDMPTDTRGIAHYATAYQPPHRIADSLAVHARTQVLSRHPDHPRLQEAAAAAVTDRDQASLEHWEMPREHDRQLSNYGTIGRTADPEHALRELQQRITSLQADLATARHTIGTAEQQLAAAAQSRPQVYLGPAHDNPPPTAVAGYRQQWNTERAITAMRNRVLDENHRQQEAAARRKTEPVYHPFRAAPDESPHLGR